MNAARIQLSTFLLAALALPVVAQPPPGGREGGRSCSICHASWAEAFRRPEAITLIDKPPDATVWQQDSCLGCHDGSVGDSRKRVWVEHGHQVGVAPPMDMKIPRELPLIDNKIVCRTCHTAHSGLPGETFATTFFLRLRNEQSQLCQACHPNMAKGPELGTHPVGGMPWPVPEALVSAGAKVGPDRFRLICETCHTPHGSRQDNLLVMGTAGGTLCLTCHAQIRPGLWRPDVPREHPQTPQLDAVQLTAVQEMGTRTSPDGTLICFSCHKLHHGLAGRYMLADGLHDSQLCLRCHPGRADMFGTRHDLRLSAPAERNRLGQTPEESGPCGACHSFHQFARRPKLGKHDPSGLCATCHAPGEVAANVSGFTFSHPVDVAQKDSHAEPQLTLYPQPEKPAGRVLACLTCHNPHEVKNTDFLRYPSATLCAACHGEKLATLPPQHDFTTHPDLKNAQGETGQQAGKCGFCHDVHKALGPALWVATPQPPQTFDGMCTQCHKPGGMAAKVIPAPLQHPSGPDTAAAAAKLRPNLPLYNERGEPSKDGFMACGSCHDPHGSGRSEQMLRLADAREATGLCAQCHDEGRIIAAGLHSQRVLETAGFDNTRFCAPCHAAHAKAGTPQLGMWSGPLGQPGDDPHGRKCTGCHSADGGAPVVTPGVHPGVILENVDPPGSPGYLPLADEPGGGKSITCNTCHLPHGRDPPVALPGTDVVELRNLRPMLRPYLTPNLCTTCHGFDGLRRYLYYHHPSLRAGRLEETPP